MSDNGNSYFDNWIGNKRRPWVCRTCAVEDGLFVLMDSSSAKCLKCRTAWSTDNTIWRIICTEQASGTHKKCITVNDVDATQCRACNTDLPTSLATNEIKISTTAYLVEPDFKKPTPWWCVRCKELQTFVGHGQNHCGTAGCAGVEVGGLYKVVSLPCQE
ncbi:hypothetical protein GQ44DRAFT_727049 [Phaeosphaeriaceae sp. PMI808]|nr:hypothetical protein GQ44DRAFT_727049 [Phaeosphaeriaceae sp. PMI808]